MCERGAREQREDEGKWREERMRGWMERKKEREREREISVIRTNQVEYSLRGERPWGTEREREGPQASVQPAVTGVLSAFRSCDDVTLVFLFNFY